MPSTLLTKIEEASLFLFGVCTGARSISCEGIQLRDIVRLKVSSIESQKTLQIWVKYI